MDKIINVKPIPHFNYSIGELPTSYKDSLTYQEQLTWLCNYLNTIIITSLNNTIDSFNELLDSFNELDSTVTETLQEYNNTLTQALENLQRDLVAGLNEIKEYFSDNLVTIAINYLNEHVQNGDIYLSLGLQYDSEDEELTFVIDSELSQELLESLSTLATPQEEE